MHARYVKADPARPTNCTRPLSHVSSAEVRHFRGCSDCSEPNEESCLHPESFSLRWHADHRWFLSMQRWKWYAHPTTDARPRSSAQLPVVRLSATLWVRRTLRWWTGTERPYGRHKIFRGGTPPMSRYHMIYRVTDCMTI